MEINFGRMYVHEGLACILCCTAFQCYSIIVSFVAFSICIVLINTLLSLCVLQLQTYDILYDDKDTIKRQPRYAYTLMEETYCEGDENPPAKGKPMWLPGTKVKANYQGKGSWYNGVISAAYVSTGACRLGLRI